MQKLSTSTKVKIAVMIMLFITYASFMKYINPILNNQMAIAQFNDTNQAYIQYQMYQDVIDILPIAMVVTIVSMFISNIKRMFIKNK